MKEKCVRVALQAHPGAKRNEIVRFDDGVWHLKIAATPKEGKANKELIDFLSEILDVRKSRIIIEKGTTGHRKLISVEGLSQEQTGERLRKYLDK